MTTVNCFGKIIGLLIRWDNPWLITDAYIPRPSEFVFCHASMCTLNSPSIITSDEGYALFW